MLVATLLSLFASPAHALSPAYGFGEVRPLDGSAEVATTVMPVVEALGLTLTAGDAEGEFVVVLQEVGTDAVVPAEVEAIGAGNTRSSPMTRSPPRRPTPSRSRLFQRWRARSSPPAWRPMGSCRPSPSRSTWTR